MVADDNLVTYSTPNIVLDLTRRLMKGNAQRSGIAVVGNAVMTEKYSKARRWENFVSITHQTNRTHL
jgi:hypothetical protein